jgi:hypothetical protein
MRTKTCSCCQETKDVCEFGLKRTNKDGLQSRCKICRKIESKEYLKKNPNVNKIYWEKNKEKRSEDYKKWVFMNENYHKEWRLKNPEKVKQSRKLHEEKNKEEIREKRKEYRIKNREKLIELSRTYREKNKVKINESRRLRRNENLEYYREKERLRYEENSHLKLIRNYRTRVKNYIKFNKFSLNTGTYEIVGLTAIDLKLYLESKFVDGMSWDNYGLRGWHVDHITPLSSAKNDEELKSLCHYTNLQPLWWFDNLSKGDKIII